MSRNELPNSTANNFGQRVRETVQTLLGRQGSVLDRAITLRDLTESGIAGLASQFVEAGSANRHLPLVVGTKIAQAEVDLTPPPTPTGLYVSPAISSFVVGTDTPVYGAGGGHLSTVIFGVTVPNGGALPTFANAVQMTEYAGSLESYATNPNTTWRIWAKWKTRAGVLSSAPAGGTNGLEARTGQDVGALIDALTGQITESTLYSELGDKIALIDGNQAGSVNARIVVAAQAEAQARTSGLLAEAAARGTAIANEVTQRTAADSALAQQMTTLTTATNGNVAAIQQEITARTDALNAEATARLTLAARVGTAESGITSLNTTTAAQAQTLSSLSTRVGGTESGIATLNTTTAGQASRIETLVVRNAGDAMNADPMMTSFSNFWELFSGNTPQMVAGSATARNAFRAASINWFADKVFLPVNPAKTYRISARFRSGAGTNGAVYLAVLLRDDIGNNISVDGYWWYYPVAGVSPPTTWTDYSAIFGANSNRTFPSNAAAMSVGAILMYGSSTGWHEVELIKLEDWTANAAVTIETTARQTADTALTNTMATQFAAVNGNVAALQTSQTTTANNVSALTSSVSTLQSTVGANTASIQTEATARTNADNDIYAKYTVKIDTNGYVSGYGLMSTANNGTPTSNFAVRADKFFIASPSGPGIAPALPFIVQTTPTTINGEAVPVGVYMDEAFIRNGTMSNAKIGNLSADKITAGYLSAARLLANSITADKIDARGLTIKDASGNVILGSGTGLNWSNITNQPSTIYNSNVTIGSNGQLNGGGGGQVTIGGLGYTGDLNATNGAIIGQTLKYVNGALASADELRNNLIDVGWWKKDATSPWAANAEYNRLTNMTDVASGAMNFGPRGGDDTVWYCKEVTGDSNQGGGWNAINTLSLNPGKTYRFVLPVFNRTGTNGSAYWGTYGVCILNTTTENGNPYFSAYTKSLMQTDRWYLIVGYVYPYGSTGNTHASAGVWDCKTGEKVASGYSYNHTATGASSHRAYQYYTSLGNEMAFGRPMVNLVDGTEPSLREYFESTAVLNTALVPSINSAATTATWGGVGNRPRLYRAVAVGASATVAPIGRGLYDAENMAMLYMTIRSYKVVVFSRSTGAIASHDQFDVYGSAAEAARMAGYLNGCDYTQIVVVMTYNEPQTNRLLNGLDAAMYRCGASKGVFGARGFMHRSAYVLIGIPGMGHGNGYEAYSGAADNDANAWVDVPFSIQNGQATMSGAASQPVIDAGNVSTYIKGAAIGSAQIEDAAITRAKIGAAAIGNAQIEDAAITRAKIGNLAVDTLQLSDESVSSTSKYEYIESSYPATPPRTGSTTMTTYMPKDGVLLLYGSYGMYGSADGDENFTFSMTAFGVQRFSNTHANYAVLTGSTILEKLPVYGAQNVTLTFNWDTYGVWSSRVWIKLLIFKSFNK
jgi:hypothetical protein